MDERREALQFTFLIEPYGFKAAVAAGDRSLYLIAETMVA